MENRYFDNVISEMQSFLDEQGFKNLENDGEFANQTHKILVSYNETSQMYQLSLSSLDENGEFSDYKAISSWLFDDSQNEKDAAAVAIDFTNSLKKSLGIKTNRTNSGAVIELPTASKTGNMTVNGFAKKMLDVFPAIKDDYKQHISIYGNFLYINFFGEFLVPQLKTLFVEGNKKQIKKLYDVFEDAYLKGDKDTINIMVALLCAASYNDETATASIKQMLNEDTHFLQSYLNFVPMLPKNKKLFKALVK